MKQKISDLFSSLPVQLICRFFLGGIFIYASIDKIVHPHEFARIIHNYQILPDFLVYIVAATMPFIELITGLFLIAGLYKETSAIVLSSMLMVFIIAISFNLIRGINFDCGCFTTVAKEGGSDPVGLLIRDILMLIPAAIIIFFTPVKSEKEMDTNSSSPAEVPA